MTGAANLRQSYLVMMAVLAWLAVVLQIFLAVRVVMAAGQPPIDGVINTLSYFTILTNLLVAIVVTAAVSRGNADTFLTRSGTMSAVAVYISIVGLVYLFFLRALWAPTGLQLIVDRTLHDVVPVLYVVYWLFFVPKATLRWIQPVYWLIYPLLYFTYCLVRGAVTGFYPYPFADVAALGYSKVLANTAMLFVGFWAVGSILVAVDQLIGRYTAGNFLKD